MTHLLAHFPRYAQQLGLGLTKARSSGFDPGLPPGWQGPNPLEPPPPPAASWRVHYQEPGPGCSQALPSDNLGQDTGSTGICQTPTCHEKPVLNSLSATPPAPCFSIPVNTVVG